MKTINLNQLLQSMSKHDQVHYESLNELLLIHHNVFNKLFSSHEILKEEVTLQFDNKQDAQAFYLECHYGKQILKHVGVYYDVNDDCCLILKPVLNIIGLIDGRKEGLCEISQLLDLNFKVSYQQAFTNTTFECYIHNGELIKPQCDIKINETLPILGLGRLFTLIRNEYDFKRLNAKITLVESESIYEPTKSFT